MFDQSSISAIKGGLFNYCPNLTDCRYMFAQCTALIEFESSTINETSTKNIFTASYPDLTDVTGMFR